MSFKKSTYLTSFPPWANDPKVAVKTCKNENNLLTFSSSMAWFRVAPPEWLINGTLLELAEMLALTLVWFIPSRLMPLSTFSKQCFAVVVVILLFLVDVMRSFVPALRMMLGGRVRSLTESFLTSFPRPLSLCSESGGDGVATYFGGDKWLLLKVNVVSNVQWNISLHYSLIFRLRLDVEILQVSSVDCILILVNVIQTRDC